jgi:hypothetical protein
LLVAGGHVEPYIGLPYATIYNPFQNTWTRVPNMNDARWYPTNTTLANGDVLVISGNSDGKQYFDDLPQVYQVSTNSWRSLTSAVLHLQLYPFMFLAPNGKVFAAGWNPETRYLTTSGTGSWSFVANSKFGWRNYGSAVMYEPGKIVLIGGGGNSGGAIPTATAEKIDLNSSAPAWSYAASMHYPRRQHNATLLPDGKILVTGGSKATGFDNYQGAVYAAELYDPAANTWTVLASAAKYRGDHSFAILLPDGRVLTGGSQLNSSGQANGANAEIFYPPYLFKGARPTTSSAPSSVGYGQTAFVGTPDAASISKVTWIRLGSVTHSFNQTQRFQRLTFSQASGGLNVVFPSSANQSPPGHYLEVGHGHLGRNDDPGFPALHRGQDCRQGY